MRSLLHINLLGFVLILMSISNLCAGTLVIGYGFEDWVGSASVTPGYIFSSTADSYWSDHVNSTNVIRSTTNAYSGSYYLHRQFNTTLHDPLLGRVATSINDHGNIGLGGRIPQNSGNKIKISEAITTNTITVRFRFRVTDEWKNQASVNGYCKFFRLYGTGGGNDNASSIVHLARDNNTSTRYYIYDPSIISYGTRYYSGVDLLDGKWHSFCVQVVRNNNSNSNGNITTKVWWDNWNMTSDPLAQRTITCPEFGSKFWYFQIAQNWSATYPTTLMGIDLDDIEVWDGSPDTTEVDLTPPNPPDNVIISQ